MRFPKPIATLTLTIALAVAPVLATAAAADTRLDMKSHTDAFEMMGQSQPAQDREITYWVGGDRVRRDDGESSFLLRADQEKLYLLDHAQETYSVLALPIDVLALMPAEMRAQMEGLVQQMAMKATVTPTEERKEINGWQTRRYDLHLENQMGMKISSAVWTTEQIDADLDAFRRLYGAMAALQPGGAEAMEEILKIPGIPVLTEARIEGMGGSFGTSEELVAAENAPAPAGTYEVPEEYTETSFNPMGQGGR